MNISLIVAAGAGVLSFLSPCVLLLVPSYLAFVAGASSGDFRRPGGAARRTLLVNALGFIVGFSLVFVAMGRRSPSLAAGCSTTGGSCRRPAAS